MPRLIDADALKHYMALTDDGHAVCYVPSKNIRCAPTIDAVPVVRCAKCIHGEFEPENRMWACVRCAEYDEHCDMFTGFIEYHNEDHFCSYGERRSE